MDAVSRNGNLVSAFSDSMRASMQQTFVGGRDRQCAILANLIKYSFTKGSGNSMLILACESCHFLLTIA